MRTRPCKARAAHRRAAGLAAWNPVVAAAVLLALPAALLAAAPGWAEPAPAATAPVAAAPAAAAGAAPGGGVVVFDLADGPGNWFDNPAGDITGTGTRSLAVAGPGVTVVFSMNGSNTTHTVTSLIVPAGAAGMPFDQTEAYKGGGTVRLETPGLYVFTCKVHPYMFGAVVVDDPRTPGLDLGEAIQLANGIVVPTDSDLATRLLRTFFIATSPRNWQRYGTAPERWHVAYPDVEVRVAGGAVVNLRQLLESRYGNDVTLPPAVPPATPGVGEVWVNTEFERTAGKRKPGTATRVNARTWQVERKVALPAIDLNHPHNMWTDPAQSRIYQTMWFDRRLAVFDRETGRLVAELQVGESPSHVITNPETGDLYVAVNGQNYATEIDGDTLVVRRNVMLQGPGDPKSHPHGHWVSHDGTKLVTPNALTGDTTLYDLASNRILARIPTGALPIATSMMPDGSRYYVANFLDSTLSVIDVAAGKLVETINLLEGYDPLSGRITGPAGGLPIQTPVSPDGRVVVTANTLTSTITVLDTRSNRVVKALPCDAGCHGVQFGAKQGGGYYAYVASKFSNRLIVVDPDPDGDGDPRDARIAGSVLLVASPGTATDDRITEYEGMGGQGVLPIPVVYNGWVQRLPAEWQRLLTPEQRCPVGC